MVSRTQQLSRDTYRSRLTVALEAFMPLSLPKPIVALITLPLILRTEPATAAQGRIEIVVIAGNHGLHLTRGYSPTELRALLRKIAPEAVGVENFPEWQEAGVQFHPGLSEPAVAMSWAARAGVPVYGVKNGDDVPGWQSQAKGLASLRDSSATVRSQAHLNSLRRNLAGQARMAFEYDESIAWANSQEGVRRRATDRQRYTAAQQTWMAAQDDTVAQGILALVRRYRPRRFAVIMGSDHFGPTRTRLQGQPGITVLSTESFFPLTQAELQDAWDPFDAAMVLGANLDHPVARAAPHSRDQARTRAELDRLTAYAPDSAPTLYYLARWYMLFERWNQAEPLLNRLRAGAPGADLPMPVAFAIRSPPLPTYRALATFALATLHDLRGNHDAARPLYRELLGLPPADLRPRIAETTTFDVRAYVDSLMASAYVGGREEYGRLLDARRPLVWSDAPEPIRSLAARRSGLTIPPP